MIDWQGLIKNGIWIFGAALALAVLSIAYYKSQQKGEKLGVVLKAREFSLSVNIAGGLFSSGMGLIADQWWEIALWIILVLMFGVQVYSAIKSVES